MDASAAATWVAAVVAVWAAFQARQQVDEAREQVRHARDQANQATRANDMALHDRKLAVYAGVRAFEAHVISRGRHLREDSVWQYLEHADHSEFYFHESVHQQLKKLALDALGIVGDAERFKELEARRPGSMRLRPEFSGEFESALAALSSKVRALRDAVADVAFAMRSELVVAAPVKPIDWWRRRP